jgi:hypothetical protein
MRATGIVGQKTGWSAQPLLHKGPSLEKPCCRSLGARENALFSHAGNETRGKTTDKKHVSLNSSAKQSHCPPRKPRQVTFPTESPSATRLK